MYRCPITYYADNLYFNADKSIWAAYRFTGYDYDFLSEEEKYALVHRLSRFLASVVSEAQILMLPVNADVKAHYEQLDKKLHKEDPLHDKAAAHCRSTRTYLQDKEEAAQINDYQFYVLLKLQDSSENEWIAGFRELYQLLVRDPINAIHTYMNLDTRDVLASKILRCKKIAKKWFALQSERFRLEPLSLIEMQWLIRRVSFRGLDKVPVTYKNSAKEAWQPKSDTMKTKGGHLVVRPYQKDVELLFSGTVVADQRSVRVHHISETSYQTFLIVSVVPDSVELPGEEWLYMLQKNGTAAEVIIHIRAVDYKKTQKKLDNKKQEITSQMEHVEEAAGRMPGVLEDGLESADALEAEIRASKDPVLYTSITICLAGSSMEELDTKVAKVKMEMEDLHFAVERSYADQIRLYIQSMPSVGRPMKEYVIPMTPLMLASGVIGATHQLGDAEGPYIGTTGEACKPVYLNQGRACLLNQSAAATFYGNLGYGKSFNANLLIVLNVLYGGYGLIFDPKGERGHWESEFTLLRGNITTVTISPSKENKGRLDPYNVYKHDIDAAGELALGVISELLKLSPSSLEYTALQEAASRVRQEWEDGKVASMSRLIDHLGGFDKDDELCVIARQLARRMGLLGQAGLSRLLLGDGTEDAITIDNRLNIIQMQNLKLPSPEAKKEDYTTEETLSTVIMMVLSHFAKQFALVKRPVFKTILFDESWALAKTTEGVKLFDWLARMGRSLYTGCIFNGHSVLDIPTEGLKNTITYKFCFHTNSETEASRMCQYLGIEDSEANRDKLKTLKNAQCMFRDLDGRVGILQFDAVFDDLCEVFSTTPTTQQDSVQAEVEESQEGKSEPDDSENLHQEYALDLEDITINIFEKVDPEEMVDLEDADIDIYAKEDIV